MALHAADHHDDDIDIEVGPIDWSSFRHPLSHDDKCSTNMGFNLILLIQGISKRHNQDVLHRIKNQKISWCHIVQPVWL